jgi:hypothetical protein
MNQKRAYKVLSMLLKVCFCFQFATLYGLLRMTRWHLNLLCINAGLFQDAEFIERNLDVLLELMISSLPCQFPSKRYRLECLHHLIVHIFKVGKTNTSWQFLDKCSSVSGRAVTNVHHFLVCRIHLISLERGKLLVHSSLKYFLP